MSVSGDVSRIVTPYMPSFLHLSLVQTTLPLASEFDIKTLEDIFTGIQHGITARFDERSPKGRKSNKALEMVLLIPAHLRHLVYETVMGMHWVVSAWQMEHEDILKLKGECIYQTENSGTINFKEERILYWRSDGCIDRTKTAQNLVLNERISIGDRFHLACMYCLKDSIQTLWNSMAGETILDRDNRFMTNFWISLTLERSSNHWLRAVRKNPVFPLALGSSSPFRISSFFPLLSPKARRKFLKSLVLLTYADDLKLCIYAVTKKEEKKILKRRGAISILRLYLNWPLQRFFLQMAEKLWDFIDDISFYVVLDFIWRRKNNRKDFDYCQLFVDFWNRSPISLREVMIEIPTISEMVDSCFNEISKRKNETGSVQKKWFRRSGRLKRTI